MVDGHYICVDVCGLVINHRRVCAVRVGTAVTAQCLLLTSLGIVGGKIRCIMNDHRPLSSAKGFASGCMNHCLWWGVVGSDMGHYDLRDF